MKKLIPMLLFTLALFSCRSSKLNSELNSATFNSGTWTFYVYFEGETFKVQKCRLNGEIDRAMQAGDGAKAKEICRETVSSVTTENMIASIQNQLSSIEASDLINAKTNRLNAISSAISELEKNASSETTLRLTQPILDSLKDEQNALTLALAQARSDASMKNLKDIDIQATLKLASLTADSARSTAEAFTQMLKSTSALYRLDANQNRMLVRAVEAFDPLCQAGVRGGETLEVDQGTERIRYRCDGDGKLVVNQVTCPLAGYERVQDFCVFTGKDLALATLTPSHSGICAVTKANVVTCWGKPGTFPLNFLGTSPVVPGAMTRVKPGELGSMAGLGTPLTQTFGKYVIGSDHAMCSLDSSSKLSRCWNDVKGAPLNGDSFRSVQGAYAHYCGITNSGAVKCWGEDDFAQSSVPSGIGNVRSLSLGNQSSCVITESGKVECWGTHVGAFARSSSQPPSTLPHAIAVSTAAMHACAILDDKSVRCWGQNDYGQINVPADLGAVRSLLTSHYESCAITLANDLRCWGQKASASFQTAPALTNVSRIVTGDLGFNSCAITTSGKVSCWGSTVYNGNYSVEAPANLASVDDLAITAVGYICARLSTGGITCWGNTDEVPNKVPSVFVK